MPLHERRPVVPPTAPKRPPIDWPRPASLSEAELATVNLWATYSRTNLPEANQEGLPDTQLTHSQASDTLLGLADQIMHGEVRTHVDVARAIRKIDHLIGPLGATETEVDLACFRVRHAVLTMQESFVDPEADFPPSRP